jgi:hypothetical protein
MFMPILGRSSHAYLSLCVVLKPKLYISSTLNIAIPCSASTGPEQGFPCVVFPHREKPVFISWDSCNENRDGFAVCSAYTIDCVCSKMLNHGLNHRLFISLFKLIPCTIH